MDTFAFAHKNAERTAKLRAQHTDSPNFDPVATGATSIIHRKASCACGGGCPSCQSKSSHLKISQPTDAAEIEADRIADQVMRMPAASDRKPVSSSVVASGPAIQRQPTGPATSAEEEPDPLGEGLATVAENLGENNPEFSEVTENLADRFLSQPAPISVGIPAFLGANYAFLWTMAMVDPAMRRHLNDFNLGTLPGIVPQFPIKTFTYRILNSEQTQFEFDLGFDASGLIEMLNERAFNTHISTLSLETSGRLDTEAASGPPIGLSSLNVNLGLFDDGVLLSGGFRQGVDPYPIFARDPHTGEGSRIMQQVPGLPDLYPGQQDVRFMLQVDFVKLYNHFNPERPPILSIPQQFEGDRVDRQIQRKCAECDEEEEETIQRRPVSSAGPVSAQEHDHVHAATTSGGHPLDDRTREFFEPRLGYDLSNVRVHTDPAAARSATAVDARAYTLGTDIVFGSAEYAPHSEAGRHLIAHELAHVAQQSQGRGGRTIHRTLKIDTASSDDRATAVPMMSPLITSLCPDFEVNSADFVVPKAGTACSIPRFAAVAGGSHPLGCCCLCTMTRPFGPLWTIVVTATNAPVTRSGSNEVRMTPTSGPTAPELRQWSTGPVERTSVIAPAEGLGHELCGHAALMKIRAHPADTGDRAYTDEHDPTVRIQNELATEMGIVGPRRGLAAGGTHRGESLRVFNVGPFNADSDDPAPFAAQITAAVDFLNGKPELLFDTVGFRDGTDTNAAISSTRAVRVRSAIVGALTTLSTSVETTPGVTEVLARPQPSTDGGLGGSRMVEILMAIRPAGLVTPIGTAPPAVPVHVDEELPGRVGSLKRGSVNQCHQLLANTAWP